MGTPLNLATLSPDGRNTLFGVLAAALVLVPIALVTLGSAANVVTKFRDGPVETLVVHAIIWAVVAAIAWIWFPTGVALLVGAGVSLAVLLFMSP